MRVQQLFFEQVPRHLLYPLRLNVGDAPAKEARGFHQLGSHDPAARFFAQLGTGVTVKLDAARTQVPILLITFLAQVAQQTAQHRLVQLLVACGFFVQFPTLFAHGAHQLRVNVTPFAYTAHVDEVFAQQVLVLAIRQFVDCIVPAARIAQPFPQLQVADKLAFVIIKLGMRLVGLGLLVHRAVTHVLHAERTGNHQHFIQCASSFGLQNHAAHARVQRQLGQRVAHSSQLVVVINSAQLGQ